MHQLLMLEEERICRLEAAKQHKSQGSYIEGVSQRRLTGPRPVQSLKCLLVPGSTQTKGKGRRKGGVQSPTEFLEVSSLIHNARFLFRALRLRYSLVNASQLCQSSPAMPPSLCSLRSPQSACHQRNPRPLWRRAP